MEQPAKEDNESAFYTQADKYWKGIPATVDGMLGGFGFISHTDIRGSDGFLKGIFKWKYPPGKQRALDCGAGIGRITKHLLQKHFQKVDLVEQNQDFLSEAREFLQNSKKVGELYPVGLQAFTPEAETYDVIWCQWVLGHLTDDDFVAFFKRCRQGLKYNGVIVVKENVTSSGLVERDDVDSSVTRPVDLLAKLLNQAELKIISRQKQHKFPKGLYEVQMFALRPHGADHSILITADSENDTSHMDTVDKEEQADNENKVYTMK